jgi:hypothetical protein
MMLALYIASGLLLGWLLKIALTWLAERFPIKERKCPCEFHRRKSK